MSNPRNPINTRHGTTVRLPADLLDALTAECERRVIGRNVLIVHLLREGVARLAAQPLVTSEGADFGRREADDGR